MRGRRAARPGGGPPRWGANARAAAARLWLAGPRFRTLDRAVPRSLARASPGLVISPRPPPKARFPVTGEGGAPSAPPPGHLAPAPGVKRKPQTYRAERGDARSVKTAADSVVGEGVR